jgi:branched-chain amino acid transport system substrate-binding protein
MGWRLQSLQCGRASCRKRVLRKFIVNRLAIVGLLLVAVGGCTTAPPPPPLVIGHVMDRTRPDRAGEQAEQGIRLALHELNKDNALTEALGGREVQVRHTDTRGALAADEAESVRLVSINRAVALFGGLSTAEVTALDQTPVPLLTFVGQQPAGATQHVFYLGMTPTVQGEALARHVADEKTLQRIVLFGDERRLETPIVLEAFEKTLAEARQKEGGNLPVLLKIRFGKEPRWDELVQRGRSHQPDAVLFAGAAADFNAWRRALSKPKAGGEPQVIYAGDDGAAASFDADPATKGILLATAFLPGADGDRPAAFVKAYREAFHAEPDVNAALAYDGFRILAAALRQAQQPTPERIREHLEKTKDFEGLTGPLSFTADRMTQRPVFLARWQNGILSKVRKVP